MLSNYESELFQSVAHDPLSVPRRLISPEVNMAGQWFSTPFAVKVFSAIARDALSDKSTSFISIMGQCGFTDAERQYMLALWNQGKSSGNADISSIVDAMRNGSMSREINRIWGDYNSKLKSRPDGIREYVNDMGAELANVSHDGVGYNPDPTTHYNDDGMEITGSWRCNAIDGIYGGIPNSGYGLFIAPSGFGKSSFSRSLIIYSVIRSVIEKECRSLIAVNEMDSGVTSRGIRDSLRDIWQNERSWDDIDGDVRRYVKLYEDVYSFSRFEQMIYWHRPNLAVIDSLDALTYPPGVEKYKDPNDKHQARAIALHDISKKYGCFILVPSNASGDNQIALKNGNLAKVQNATAFNSIWYQNKSSFSTVMTWDTVNLNTSLFKNTKDRVHGQKGMGHIFSMAHSDSGHYYRDVHVYDPNA